jgi:hypothetical protein
MAVGVAAGILLPTSTELVVNTRALLSYNAVAYKLPPMPTPPETVNAPVLVDVEIVEAESAAEVAVMFCCASMTCTFSTDKPCLILKFLSDIGSLSPI